MELPISCTLGPSDGAERRRRWEALADAGAASARRSGHRLEVRYRAEPGVRDELEALAAAERDCCSFVTWDVSRDRDEAVLHVRADPGSPSDLDAIAILFAAS
ncbi:MAG TPA: hypothetical protein VFB44_03775 [Thermoleophilaceae bacterium]|nr:hypothetical protein [Thermoleophilaceae bacterium]